MCEVRELVNFGICFDKMHQIQPRAWPFLLAISILKALQEPNSLSGAQGALLKAKLLACGRDKSSCKPCLTLGVCAEETFQLKLQQRRGWDSMGMLLRRLETKSPHRSFGGFVYFLLALWKWKSLPANPWLSWLVFSLACKSLSTLKQRGKVGWQHGEMLTPPLEL